MKYKGVSYDAGRVMMGENWRPKFDLNTVQREIEIISKDLHASSIRICGQDIERLVNASEFALAEGMDVWLSPELWDSAPEQTLDYLTQAAKRAEELRKKWPDRITFSVGSELTLFMQGIIEGSNVFQRMSAPSFLETIRTGKHNDKLNMFLSKASREVRKHFRGPVTYFSVPLEQVDWAGFDYVGVDLYRDARIRDSYEKLAKSYQVHDKPVINGEFGTCTYKGAELLGGNGFVISIGMIARAFKLNLDEMFPEFMIKQLSVPPMIDGHYIRDEHLQAQEVLDQLSLLDRSGVTGAFVFCFISQNNPYNPDPRFDADMANYSLVKSYPEPETVQYFAEQNARKLKSQTGHDMDPTLLKLLYQDIGKHGTTYPDMPWEPKESFRAVADYYSRN